MSTNMTTAGTILSLPPTKPSVIPVPFGGNTPTKHLVSFEIDSDSDSESELSAASSELLDPDVNVKKRVVAKRYPTTITGRPIAGGRRVSDHRSRGTKGGAHGGGRFFQSITATPAFSGSSFEEMRLECYVQALVASGKPPQAVDAVKSPMGVLPPMFNAFRQFEDDGVLGIGDDVSM
ncbi:hypothetical protein C0991_001876 [Blastosporella zonata]|nr:hypothetical protein C0991_001876 [Blastosporella zonata]